MSITSIHSVIDLARVTLQALTDSDKIQKCRAVAERGLSDLQAYAAMQATVDSGNMQITLKGATST